MINAIITQGLGAFSTPGYLITLGFDAAEGDVVSYDAVAIIRHQLVNDATLIAAVPATRIAAGELVLGSSLPAIRINEVSRQDRTNVAMDATGVLKTARVEVTIFAADYPTQKTLVRLVRAACANFRGDITALGVNVDSILPGGVSPDIKIPDIDVLLQSRDFIVRYSEL